MSVCSLELEKWFLPNGKMILPFKYLFAGVPTWDYCLKFYGSYTDCKIRYWAHPQGTLATVCTKIGQVTSRHLTNLWTFGYSSL